MESAFVGVLYNLDKMLRKEIHELDKMLEKLANEPYALPAGAAQFTKFIAEKLFGPSNEHVLESYEQLLEALTSSILDREIRQYYIRIFNARFKYDPVSGNNNLDQLAQQIISVTNQCVNAIEANNPELIQKFGDRNKLTMATLFLCMHIIISGVALRRGLDRLMNGEKVARLITQIYYGYTIEHNQYIALRERNLLGGIIFRGIETNPRTALSILSKKRVNVRGTSWTADYTIALSYAISKNQLPPETLQVASLSTFIHESNYGKKWFFVDGVGTAMAIIEYIIKNGFDKQFGIGIVFSALLDKKSLLYLGEKAPEHFKSSMYTFEQEILAHQGVAVADNSIDTFIFVK